MLYHLLLATDIFESLMYVLFILFSSGFINMYPNVIGLLSDSSSITLKIKRVRSNLTTQQENRDVATGACSESGVDRVMFVESLIEVKEIEVLAVLADFQN